MTADLLDRVYASNMPPGDPLEVERPDPDDDDEDDED
jgi:hypothetical protein